MTGNGMRLDSLRCAAVVIWIALPGAGATVCEAKVLQVGPGKTFSKPCAAIASARPGDVIEVDAAGNYDGDVCVIRTGNLTLRGIGGRARIDAAGRNAAQKGIWVLYADNITVENFEFSGATVPDKNGAGIRAQGGGRLTIRNCYFHDNEDGILGPNAHDAEVLIEYSEFARNGYGDGYSHNIYIGHAHRFTLRYSYSHDARSGQLVKSRASENYILYNRLTTEDQSRTSYEIDIPNGGRTYIIGNVVCQGANGDNSGFFPYGLEGPNENNPSDHLYVVNNTFFNARSRGWFIKVGNHVRTPVVIQNNIFTGPGAIINQEEALLDGNFTGDAHYVNAGNYDYHLRPDSPAIDRGVDPGTGDGYSLMPVYQYVHPASGEQRRVIGKIDIGAFEYDDGSSGGRHARRKPPARFGPLRPVVPGRAR